jgi:hypothetical protein
MAEKSKPIVATPPPAPETSTQDLEPKQREQKSLASASPKPSEQGCMRLIRRSGELTATGDLSSAIENNDETLYTSEL